MSQNIEELTFTPRAAELVGDDVRNWLADINSRLLSQGLAAELAKEIFINRGDLSIDDKSLAEVTGKLAEHYKFKARESSGSMGVIELRKDVQAVLELESFGIDPFIVIDEYNKPNWINELQPYSDSRLKEQIRFFTFASACMAATVNIKATELLQKAGTERDRILTMSEQEWRKYCNGILWSQSARAQDVYNGLLSAVKQISATTSYIDGLYFVRDKKDVVTKVFEPLKTVQLLNQNSQVDITRINPIIVNRDLNLNNVLIPTPNNPS